MKRILLALCFCLCLSTPTQAYNCNQTGQFTPPQCRTYQIYLPVLLNKAPCYTMGCEYGLK